ncbi:MAG TPA: alpha/beta hydrolase [Chitinophagaceae bacterium]|nr:alpha/beta hydrolase [Chitinophagaceae bacterium]
MKKAKFCIPLLIVLISLWGCTKENSIRDEGNLVPETVEKDPNLPSISVNGTLLHAETYGNPDSAMVIVLHGGPGSDYRHLLNCKAIANQGYHVVFYDQRGSGLSKRHNKSTYSIQLMLDDLSAVIAHYRKSPAQKIFLLGHSWGAILATAFIDKYPTAINGAILAEPGGFIWEDIEAYVSRARDIKITSELISDFLYSDQFITGKKDEHAILDYKYGLLASAEGNKDNPIGDEGPLLFWRSGAIVNQALFEIGDREEPNWTLHLIQYQTKVLFVYSEHNRAYGLAHAQKVSSAYPNVQLFKVNGAGHDMLSFPTGWSNFYPVAINYLDSLK